MKKNEESSVRCNEVNQAFLIEQFLEFDKTKNQKNDLPKLYFDFEE